MNQSYQNSEQQVMDPVADLLAGEHPVAYRVSFSRVVGGACPALLLSQFYHWTNTPTAKARDGWFFLTQAEITTQTGLTIRETETARKKLKEAGVLQEEKRGLPMKLWFHVDKNALYRLLRAHVSASNQAETNLPQNVEDGSDAPSPHLLQNVEDCSNVSQTNLLQNVEDCVNDNAANLSRNVEDITVAKTSSENSTDISAETTNSRTPKPASAPEQSVVCVSDKSVQIVLGKEENLVSRLERLDVETDEATYLVRDFSFEIVDEVISSVANRKKIREAKRPASYLRAICTSVANNVAVKAEVAAEGERKRNVVRAPRAAAQYVPVLSAQASPVPDNASLDSVYSALTAAEREALNEAAWVRAMADAPAPIRARLEAASKSQEPLSKMVRDLLLIARNALLQEREAAEARAARLDADFAP